jgi:hypothetical protein
MILSGSLTDWSVPELLQIMRVTDKTATLRVEGPRSGVVSFLSGGIAGGRVSGVPPASEARQGAIDAVYFLHDAREGSFFVGNPEAEEGDPVFSVEEVMAEVGHLRDLEADVGRLGAREDSLLTLVSAPGGAVTLDPRDWEALAALVPGFTLDDLSNRGGRSRALQVVHALLQRGLVEVGAARPEGEAPPPVQDRLGETPLERAVDLSTDIPVPPEPRIQSEETEDDTQRLRKGVASNPSTTLVSGVLDEMRRLRTSSGGN